MTRLRKLLLALAGTTLAASAFVVAAPQPAGAANKYCYQVCHNNAKGGCDWIVVEANALSAHIRHGDCCWNDWGYCN